MPDVEARAEGYARSRPRRTATVAIRWSTESTSTVSTAERSNAKNVDARARLDDGSVAAAAAAAAERRQYACDAAAPGRRAPAVRISRLFPSRLLPAGPVLLAERGETISRLARLASPRRSPVPRVRSKRMLYLVGLGLGDATDITQKGLAIVRACSRVYLESYTSILSGGSEELERFYGRPILEADRELVESGADEILPKDEREDVALLVVGDPLGATTHSDLVLRAREKGLKVKIVHNASILTAVGCCGLQLYRFGETVTVPYWTDAWRPASFCEKILSNRERDLHTLCLLDIKVKEPTLESLVRKKREYMPPRFMSVAEAAAQTIEALERDPRPGKGLERASLAIGLARVGWDDERVAACSLEEMTRLDLGPPLHCLVVPAANLHPLEAEFVALFQRK